MSICPSISIWSCFTFEPHLVRFYRQIESNPANAVARITVSIRTTKSDDGQGFLTVFFIFQLSLRMTDPTKIAPAAEPSPPPTSLTAYTFVFHVDSSDVPAFNLRMHEAYNSPNLFRNEISLVRRKAKHSKPFEITGFAFAVEPGKSKDFQTSMYALYQDPCLYYFEKRHFHKTPPALQKKTAVDPAIEGLLTNVEAPDWATTFAKETIGAVRDRIFSKPASGPANKKRKTN